MGGRAILHGLRRESPSFLTSLLVHLVLLIALGLWLLPELPGFVSADLEARPTELEDVDEVEEIVLFEPQLEIEDEPIEFEEMPDTELVEETINFSRSHDLEAAPSAEVALMDFGSESAPEQFQIEAQGFDGGGLEGRGHAARKALIRKGGGNEASETAVMLALRWLAEHQNPDGSWSFDHQQAAKCQGRCKDPGRLDDAFMGGTAMALLPFLGAGQTHVAGDYQGVVGKGLHALISRMKVDEHGGSCMDSGNMYSHGLAAIALCESYGMTDDPTLAQPAQLAINFVCYAQGPRGGWRYQPNSPGDMSVVGWQIMALKSGHMAYLRVPGAIVQRAYGFLDFAQVDGGEGYAYAAGDNFAYGQATSAIGLLCRMYLGWKRDNPVLKRGVERIAQIGPSDSNDYFNYYATQVLFQFTGAEGPMWETWNTKMRDQLVKAQDQSGHQRGSWYSEGGHTAAEGGRLCKTALACMTLEVYYRHMPIYRADAVEVEFPE